MGRPALAAAVLALLVGAGAAPAADTLLSAARGARMIKRTSEAPGAPAADLIDERATAGWKSADGTFPQEIIFELPSRVRFNTLLFTPSPDAPVEQWPREVEVYGADPFPTMGGWKLAGRETLPGGPGDKTYPIPPAEGRYIRLLILSAQGAPVPRVALGRFGIALR